MSDQAPRKQRLIFVNRFFYPDESATSLMLSDLVFGLKLQGADRLVVTSAAQYTGSGARQRRDEVDGVMIHRLASVPVGQQSLAGKALNFIAFYLLSFVAVVRLARAGDIVVCLTDPPLGNLFCLAAAKLKRAQQINWVQDIYPETATRLGIGSERNPLLRVLASLRDKAWRAASANVVIGQRMAQFVATRSESKTDPVIIQNWTDEQALEPLARTANPLRKEWGYRPSDCVIGYSGNLGRAHDYETMLFAIEALANRSNNLRFLFIGGGAGLAKLKTRTAHQRHIAFRPYQPRAQLRESLCVPDVHWLSLAPQLEGLIVPSKFYGAAAAGRPTIFIGDSDGEVARLIGEAECGRVFQPGEYHALAEFLLELDQNKALRERLGRNARTYAEAALARDARLEEWSQLLAARLDEGRKQDEISKRSGAAV